MPGKPRPPFAHAGPLSSQDIASRAGVAERYAREWVLSQAAGGYARCDPAGDRYARPEEQALALADEESPFYGRAGGRDTAGPGNQGRRLPERATRDRDAF
jgi:Rv2258c-like winged HTH domain